MCYVLDSKYVCSFTHRYGCVIWIVCSFMLMNEFFLEGMEVEIIFSTYTKILKFSVHLFWELSFHTCFLILVKQGIKLIILNWWCWECSCYLTLSPFDYYAALQRVRDRTRKELCKKFTQVFSWKHCYNCCFQLQKFT